MLAVTLSDLRFRRRQFLIAVVGAALVFAMALLLSGLAQTFRTEIDQTIGAVHADAWVLKNPTSGPFTGFSPLDAGALDDVAHEPGVTHAAPLVIMRQTLRVNDEASTRSATMIGYQPNDLGQPPVSSGRAATNQGDVVVDDALPAAIGDHILLGGRTFTVTGRTRGLTLNGGIPNVYTTIDDARAIAFNGAPLETVIVTKGHPDASRDGLEVMSNAEVRADTLHLMNDAIASIDNSRSFMWLVAAVIVAALMYVSALERVRDFAVLKSLGASSASIYGSLALQAVVVSLIAAVVAAVISNFMKPVIALPVTVPGSAFIVLPVVAVVVGLISSLVGLRRAVAVDPAYAFSGA